MNPWYTVFISSYRSLTLLYHVCFEIFYKSILKSNHLATCLWTPTLSNNIQGQILLEIKYNYITSYDHSYSYIITVQSNKLWMMPLFGAQIETLWCFRKADLHRHGCINTWPLNFSLQLGEFVQAQCGTVLKVGMLPNS